METYVLIKKEYKSVEKTNEKGKTIVINELVPNAMETAFQEARKQADTEGFASISLVRETDIDFKFMFYNKLEKKKK